MSADIPQVLIVEDEDLARDRLARLVRANHQFALVAACRNGNEALEHLEAGAADVILLDVEMPGMDGMEVLRRINAQEQPPLVVFVTAHSQFAVDAFASQAVDYLLKPFDSDRLAKALENVRQRLQARAAIAMASRIRAVIAEAPPLPHVPEVGNRGRLLVRANGRIHPLRGEDIIWIEARGRSCVVHCAERNYSTDGPLSDVWSQLQDSFLRVSRSAIVNADRIRELQEMFKGNLVAVMKNGDEVPISRRFKGQILHRLGSLRRTHPK